MALKRIAAWTMLAIAAGAFAQGDASKTLVTVNGEAIKGDEYVSRMQVMPGVGRMVGDSFISAQPGFLTLQQLINERLMMQLAKEKKVYPTQKQIDDEKAYMERKYPDIKKAYEMLGVTEAEYTYAITVRLCEYNLTTMGVTVTDFEVENHYKTLLSSTYTVPTRYTLRIMIVDTEATKAKVDQEMAAGATFAQMATKYSVEISTKNNGGLLGDVAEGALSETLLNQVKAVKKGEMTPWFLTGSNWTKLLVEDVKQKQVIPLDANLKFEIKRKLMMNGGHSVNTLADWMDEMRAKAQIDYSGTPFDDELKKMFGKGGSL